MAKYLDNSKDYHSIVDPAPSTRADTYYVAQALFWWDDTKEWVLDRLSEALDVASIVTDLLTGGMLGSVFDLMNAGLSYSRGRYGETALYIAAAAPLVGYAATAAKYAGKAANAVAKVGKHVGNVASMTNMGKGLANTVKTGGKTMETGVQVAKRAEDAGDAVKRSKATKKNTEPDSCPNPDKNQCFVGDTKVLIFAEVPDEIIANWTPVRLDSDQARARNVLGMWFTVSALGVVVAIGLRSVRRRDEEDAADHQSAQATSSDDGTEDAREQDGFPVPQPLISPTQFRIVPLYEGPTADKGTRPKPETMCHTTNTSNCDSNDELTENTVPNTESDTEPQAGQFIRKSLLLSDLFGQTFNPAVGSAEACPVVLAQDTDETTTCSRFRTLLDWPHWTSVMWVSLLLCLGTCIGLAWYDSPSNTATMPAGEIGSVSGVGSRPDVEGWSGFESALLDINQIRVGMRVASENPEVSDAERRTFVDPDSATWRFLKLRLPKSADPRDFVEIEMLRPVAWLEQHSAEAGGRVLLDLEELGATGWAEVLEIGPCPEIVPGPGSVVTATFGHQPTSEILDVTITGSDGSKETIGVTANHPFWSVDHHAFVPVGLLEPGARVKTHLDQIQTIVSLHPRPGPPEKVYNLEVHGEHVYFVGEDGILVHNSCGTWTYTVKDSNGNVVYIGTGTKARVNTALTRVAKALGVDKNTLRLFSEDMGTKAASRAAENALLKKAVDAGQKFTKIGGDYIKASGNLLNKKWGTALNRTSKGNGDWFKDFWKEYDNRVGTAWDNVLKWF